MHYYKRNIGDYAKKAGRLSMLQHGSYTLLIDACYDREQFPTLEEAIEWTWASTTEEIEAVTFVLRKFFTLVDGVYIQNRIQEEINDYHKKAETNQRIAIDRETKRKEKSTNRVQDVNEPPPNHKPRTKSNKETLLPDDFSISERVLLWAEKNNHSNLDLHLNAFVLKAKAKGYKYVDWDSAFMNAISSNWANVQMPKKRELAL